MSTARRWRFGGAAAIAVNALLVAAIAVFLAVNAYPSSEAVRLRNALVLQPSAPADFAWTPPAYPADFARDAGAPLFAPEVAKLGIATIPDDWGKAVALAAHLLENARNEGRISTKLDTTYRRIREGYGYCSDFTDVYLALARAAGLDARMWGFSFDGFGGDGHAFIEIFDRQHGKWTFVDVFNNMYAVDAATGERLSALELREVLLGKRAARFERLTGGRMPYRNHPEKAWEYYRRGMDQWYLSWGTALETMDRNPVVSASEDVTHAFGQLAGVALGLHPKIRVLAVPANEAQRQRMASLRTTLLLVLPAGAILGLVLVAQVLVAVYRRVRARAS
jgi:hypothetical protein